MKLSKLVYKCVKNVIYLDDTSFTYDFIKNSNFETDNRDYKTSLENVFAPLNEAIHRLSDRNKIATKTVLLNELQENGFVDIPMDVSVKTIVNVYSVGKRNYLNIPFRLAGLNRLLILDKKGFNESSLYAEYREDIRHFDFDDIQNENDVDLKEFGVNDTMCSYIIEYCKGKLMETIDPSMAAYHNNLAEQYFDGLDEPPTSFNQQRIEKVLTI